ncbi:hypothetical protein EYC84_010824 [Monilinia fructicola]|uniref:Replication factor C C-terminal domain-containing protein n=1 Tax=Monilinia fructicola TaxID=38448 RepID=A0A5M9JCW1_MONFR|nr:hypothetical protein EYC84_010824 [Monilinia fructicola]
MALIIFGTIRRLPPPPPLRTLGRRQKKPASSARSKNSTGPRSKKSRSIPASFNSRLRRASSSSNIVSSLYHLEITPSDVGNYDRVVISELLKEVAQTQQVDQSAKQRFKVVVINEADGLSRDAQAALRRTMEKYSGNVRLILVANSTSGIIGPIRSRTLLVRKEGWGVSRVFLERVAKESGRNLRRALLMYEAAHAQNETITDSTPIPPPDWEALLSTIAHSMTVEHTPAQILKIRAQLYDLLTHCIPATTILKTLTWKLMPLVDDALKSDIVKWAAFYEHRCKTGTKLIFHLEAFVAKFMRVSEEWLMAMEIE